MESSTNTLRAWGGEGKVRLEAKYLYALCSVLGTQPGSAGCEQWDSRSFPPALEVCLCPGAGGVRGELPAVSISAH